MSTASTALATSTLLAADINVTQSKQIGQMRAMLQRLS